MSSQGNDELSMTLIHKRLLSVVKECGFQTEVEAQFGRFRVDVYVPELHAAFEADGPMHSRHRDKRRDKELLELHGLPVFRATYQQLHTMVKARQLSTSIRDFAEGVAGDADERRKLVWIA